MKRRNLSHLKLTIFLILLAVLIFAAAALILKTIKNASTQVLSWSEAVEAVSSEPVKNVQPSLSVPTQITKIGDDYFLVDCYHNQILTSKTPDAPLTDWYVMTDQINRGTPSQGTAPFILQMTPKTTASSSLKNRTDSFALPSFSTKSALARITSSMMKRKNVFMYSAP